MGLEFGGAVAASSDYTAVTSGAVNTYGSYVALISGASEAHKWVTINAHQITASALRSSIVEVATSPTVGGTKTPKFEFLLPFANTAYLGQIRFPVPCDVPSGGYVWVRHKNSYASAEIGIAIGLASYSVMGTGTAHELLGQSGSHGTTIDPGSTANDKGDWVSLGTLTDDCDYMVVFGGNNANNASSFYNYLIDIGVDPASVSDDSAVLIADLFSYCTNLEVGFTFAFPQPVSIASGSEIHARSACDDCTNATNRLVDVAVLCVKMTAGGGGGGTNGLKVGMQPLGTGLVT